MTPAVSPIPAKPHARAIRAGDYLVKRISRDVVRVTSSEGYVDVRGLGRRPAPFDATDAAQALIASGKAQWTPLPSRSGPSGGSSAARASGLRRVEAYLSPEAAAAHDRLRAELGSTRAALEWALTQAPAPTIVVPFGVAVLSALEWALTQAP